MFLISLLCCGAVCFFHHDFSGLNQGGANFVTGGATGEGGGADGRSVRDKT